MKSFGKTCSIIGLAVASQILMADQVTSTFADGEILDEIKLNEVKASINDNDARITTNTSGVAGNDAAVNDNDQRIATLENLDLSRVNVINGDNSVLGVSIGASEFDAIAFLTDTNYKVQLDWDLDNNDYAVRSGGENNSVYFTNTTCTLQAYTDFISPKSLNTFDGFGIGYTGSSLIPISAQSQLQFDSTCAVLDTPISMNGLTAFVNDPSITAFDPNFLAFPVMLSR